MGKDVNIKLPKILQAFEMPLIKPGFRSRLFITSEKDKILTESAGAPGLNPKIANHF
jgi:hypothetical protein